MKDNSKLRTKKIVICLLLSLLLIPITGCSPNILNKTDEQIAANFIKLLGYTIVSYDGEYPKYTLDRELVKNSPNMGIWAVQKPEPDLYFGNEITTFNFTVKNHPLERLYSNKEFNIWVTVMLVDHNIIGGTSGPVLKNSTQVLAGGPSSIQGKDTSEIKGMSYPQWRDYWIEKYGYEN